MITMNEMHSNIYLTYSKMNEKVYWRFQTQNNIHDTPIYTVPKWLYLDSVVADKGTG